MTSARIFGIMVRKFGYQQEFYLFILFEVDKSAEVNFYCIILLFDLAICLTIEGS